MEYRVRRAELKDTELLKEYKKHSIFDYAKDLDDAERKKINDYIDNNFQLGNYNIIMAEKKIVGAYSVLEADDVLLEEIYIEKEYRNQGIATKVIGELLKTYPSLSLWVYKNNQAFNLYKSLGFVVEKETDSRYYMVHNR